MRHGALMTVLRDLDKRIRVLEYMQRQTENRIMTDESKTGRAISDLEEVASQEHRDLEQLLALNTAQAAEIKDLTAKVAGNEADQTQIDRLVALTTQAHDNAQKIEAAVAATSASGSPN